MKAWLLSVLLLTGCAGQTAQTFIPYTPEITDSNQYYDDLQVCHSYVYNWVKNSNELNAPQIASSGLESGLDSLGSAAVSPYAPIAEGAGGASSEALNELGITTKTVKHMVSQCMHDKGIASKAYSVWDPNS